MMRISAAAPPANATPSNNASPLVIPIMEEEDMGVEVEKEDNKGTKNNPILVTPSLSNRRGSKNEPICLEDDVNSIGDRNHPISVDGYRSKDAPEAIPVKSAVDDLVLDVECSDVDPIDPKGKRPKRERTSRRSIREVGEPSSSVPPAPDAYCSICMEPKFLRECFFMRRCSHSYCSSCVAQYVEAKVEENATSIGCPDPDCKDGYLEPQLCQHLLKPETFDRWGASLCEAMIGSTKFYCPFKDCSALLIDERVATGGKVISQSECPHCNRLFCARCKVPWHSGVSCKDFAKLGADERGSEDLMLRNMAKDCGWQRCPKCKFYVEKVDGCNVISCRCRHEFCYRCGKANVCDYNCRKRKR